ncbi:MAG TPA: S41 family peptidase [Stellaceae bacterium]|nr:S41 family peptidase [Stellaceae bacterium]
MTVLPHRWRRATVAAVSLTILFGCATPEQPEQPSDLTLMREAMGLVHDRYVRDIGDDKLVHDAVKGMLAGLDPHSAYMDAKEYREFSADTRGEFGGIGAELARDGGRVKVIAPIDDTPAARAGIRPGDAIDRVNGETVDGLDLGEVVERIRGPAGSVVRLTLSRGTAAPFELELRRDIIHTNAVKARLEDGHIGYVRVSIFNERAQEQLVAAIARLKRESGGKLAGFILDLRNDPGGLLDQAVAVAGDFIDGGTIVSTRGRDGKETRRFNAEPNGDLLIGTPMVVLINGASASASEIVAGALQDYGRATLMGTRSFGKGSVQTIIPMSGHGALRITTDLYYTPAGRSIQAQGIQPDIAVVPPKEQQVAGLQLSREADLRGAFKASAKSSAEPKPVPFDAREDGLLDPLVLGTEKDSQLVAALTALRKGTVAIGPRPRATP